MFQSLLVRIPLLLLPLTLAAMPAKAVDIVPVKGGDSSELNTEVSDGEWNLVMLWAHDCIPCEKQKPMIDSFYRQNINRGVSVIGLSTDETSLRSEAAATHNKTKTSFPNFYFNGQDFQKAFQQFSGHRFLGTPTYMVFSPDGKLTDVHTGAISQSMLNKAFGDKLTKETFTPSVDLIQ